MRSNAGIFLLQMEIWICRYFGRNAITNLWVEVWVGTNAFLKVQSHQFVR